MGTISIAPWGDAARAEDPVRGGLELVRVALQHDHLQAQIVRQVHVHRRADLVPERVLHLGQRVRQVAHVMVVDERKGAHRLHVRPRLALRHQRARCPGSPPSAWTRAPRRRDRAR
jgi:hypothetical protein